MANYIRSLLVIIFYCCCLITAGSASGGGTIKTSQSDNKMCDKPSKQLVPAGVPWADTAGYSRAIKVGNIIEVAGTVAADDSGQPVGPGDIYTQSKFIFTKIEAALNQLGAKMSDVIRTRLYVLDIANNWKEAGRAHGEIFANIKPVCTMVEISKLISPEYLIEIEVSAIIQ